MLCWRPAAAKAKVWQQNAARDRPGASQSAAAGNRPPTPDVAASQPAIRPKKSAPTARDWPSDKARKAAKAAERQVLAEKRAVAETAALEAAAVAAKAKAAVAEAEAEEAEAAAAAAEAAANLLEEEEMLEAQAVQRAKEKGAAKKARQKQRKQVQSSSRSGAVSCSVHSSNRCLGQSLQGCIHTDQDLHGWDVCPFTLHFLTMGRWVVHCRSQHVELLHRLRYVSLQAQKARESCGAEPEAAPEERPDGSHPGSGGVQLTAAADVTSGTPTDVADMLTQQPVPKSTDWQGHTQTPPSGSVTVDNSQPCPAQNLIAVPDAVAASECVVCWVAEPSIIYLPCGHMCTCEGCAQSFQIQAVPACPMCRAPVTSMIASV